MRENNGNNGARVLVFDEDICLSYVLGHLSEAEQEEFEEAYFVDDAIFERYMAAKTELLDLYSRGELDPEKQEKVRIHFSATAPRRRQMADAQQFIDAVTSLFAKCGDKAADPTIDSLSRSFSWIPRCYWLSGQRSRLYCLLRRRSITAIQFGEGDGNVKTAGDPGWTPLLRQRRIPITCREQTHLWPRQHAQCHCSTPTRWGFR